ncbi:unnamed protein product [Phaeothamnion confervicola]
MLAERCIERVRYIAAGQHFARHLSIEVVSIEVDRAVLRLPYREYLGIERVNGGAIASLVDLAGTCACWSNPLVSEAARGATIGFTINYLKLVVASDLIASGQVRRRGGSLCVAEVSVCNEAGDEVAIATINYKLEPRGAP